MAIDFKKIGKVVAESDDLTKAKKTERSLPPTGKTLLRFASYIELGFQKPKNKAHKPSVLALLEFEIVHPKHRYTVEVNGVQEERRHIVQVRLPKGSTAKSGFRRLFRVMNTALGGEYTHFAEMLTAGFVGEIFHNEVGEGEEKQTYVNLDDNGSWSLSKPEHEDVITGEVRAIPVPEMLSEPKLFMWEPNPEDISDEEVKEMWDCIFIDGTYEREENGTTVEKSKNWIQELIMKSLTWEGSRVQALTQEELNLDDLLPRDPQTVELPDDGGVPTL